ncbi:hypothetical protein AJ80_09878 [Polytolypa hystricis UAMH7299]|uniref:Uncharacterized protein n=1 Tax=Polytolypa hystricis (strain UAMH7299) TaxID=1447883 RepID=A0A2B7WHH8_POLH7|nr:hypothetical protein AJ80_09878 [Polytolypa hystricis UAMH7299]
MVRRPERSPAARGRSPRRRPKLELDTEKQIYLHSSSSRDGSFDHNDDASYFYSDSSLSSPASSQPILGRPTPRPIRRRQFYRVPNYIMRWICLAVFLSLVLFIVTLFRFTIPISPLKNDMKIPEAEIIKPQPAQWESFTFLTRFYGGIRSLVSRKDLVAEYPEEDFNEEMIRLASKPNSSHVFSPYPDYTSKEYIEKFGAKVDCFLDKAGGVDIPRVLYYDGIPQGFPDAAMGSNEILGIDDNICFERFGRLAPYGLGYGVKAGGTGAGLEGDMSGLEDVWEDIPPVNFGKVRWGEAQERCLEANKHRFPDLPPPKSNLLRPQLNRLGRRGNQTTAADKVATPPPDNTAVGSERLPRTAILIRTWHNYHYDAESILYLRSLIAELSLLSGGEYTVYFLVHVKDVNLPIWSDEEVYDRVLHESLPAEFAGMGILWSEKQMELVYPGLEESLTRNLPVHGVYRSTFMPVQYFAYHHQEYDYFWNWEMDARYTGHWYHLFDKVTRWAKEQPRKGLWERNARFYIPSVHGSWEDFKHMIRVQTEIGTTSPNNLWSPLLKDKQPKGSSGGNPFEGKGDKPIWGPERPQEGDIFEADGDVHPPHTYEKDKYEWGVGDEADFIVFNPLFDPEGTTWLLRDDTTGYNQTAGQPPRRAAIITSSRLSKRLLLTMHRETSLKRHTMFSEMWAATTALHHGYKAVSIPHAIYIDRRWPTAYLESVFNAGRNGASGGARTSVFGDREHNFRGTTWFYSAGHAANVWRRWFGYRVDGNGGEEFEMANEGRMCLPPMLLHPIKNVELVIESGDI